VVAVIPSLCEDGHNRHGTNGYLINE